MKNINRLLIGLVTIFASNFANASLINVSEIRISSAVNSWLQISEFVAWSTNTDLALSSASATVSATDFYLGAKSCNSNSSEASCAIDGASFVDYPNIFHGDNVGGFNTVLTIMLAAPSTIDWIEVFGRNGCCQGRDVYDISFFDAAGKMIFSLANIEGSTTQAANRVEVSEPSILALLGLGFLALRVRRKL
ncbi:MAG: hypothetical protein ACI92E_002792 [Oceanicoccus sp.]|jgi:hypothetical protein